MKNRTLIFMTMLLLACGVKHQTLDHSPNNDLGLTRDQEYLRRLFKTNFFRGCLYLGFNPEDRKFLLSDVSFESDYALGTNGYEIVDSLVLIQVGLIKQDSIHYFDDIKLKDEEYLGMKRVLQICLKGYESNTIDSMAIVLAKQLSPSTPNR